MQRDNETVESILFEIHANQSLNALTGDVERVGYNLNQALREGLINIHPVRAEVQVDEEGVIWQEMRCGITDVGMAILSPVITRRENEQRRLEAEAAAQAQAEEKSQSEPQVPESEPEVLAPDDSSNDDPAPDPIAV